MTTLALKARCRTLCATALLSGGLAFPLYSAVPESTSGSNVSPLPDQINSLGMKFVAVPGSHVLFSIWETRVRDYAAFIQATGRTWKKTGEPTHPAMDIPWGAAVTFCRWLTEKERKEGRIESDQVYRLPTDEEWSIAVGLDEEPGQTPEQRDMKIKGVYPWGAGWPPPPEAGNYGPDLEVDRFDRPAPVGSFPSNKFGLYDMGGNVWEWVEDRWTPGLNSANTTTHSKTSALLDVQEIIPEEKWLASNYERVLRGGSFYISNPFVMLSSYRLIGPDLRYTAGFRTVLAKARSERTTKPADGDTL